VADRLPSIHDDAADTTQTNPGATAATPGGVVPKPLPTLRPDRYTPGSTPPAADLKPGAPERNNPANVSPQSPTTGQPSTTPKPAPANPRSPQPSTPQTNN
jgi:rod shape-determining protein MreC